MSHARAFLTQTSIAAMSTGSRALPLLCRKTRVLPRDATRLVRECLRMRLGEHCPAWIDELLWRHLPRLEDGRLGALVIVASRTVDPGICPKGKINETETDDAGVLVTFWLEVSDCTSRCSCFWKLTCDERAPQGGFEIAGVSASITGVLDDVRGYFDCRRAGPSAGMDVPASVKDWHSFVDRWLFGPPAPKQVSIQKWLRPRA